MKDPSILIIDDSETTSAVLAGLLEAQGLVQITEMNNGADALVWMNLHKPDLIFLDIKMPELDGWLLCEIFSNVRRWRSIPVVLESGLVGARNIKKGLQLGAHSYVEKPLTPDKIAEVLDAVFRPEIQFPSVSNPDVLKVVKKLVHATKQTFNLMLGAQTRVAEIVPLAHDFAPPVCDFVGVLKTSGIARVEISTGWSEALITRFATSLLDADAEELDEEEISSTIDEVLNLILGPSLQEINRSFAVKLQTPESSQSSPIPFNGEAPFRFEVHYKTGDYHFPMLITIDPGHEAG